MYGSCDGTITTGLGGELLCSGNWVAVASPVFTMSELSATNIAALVSAGLVTMVIAYGFRVIRKQMGF